jgi:hypothetical protein
MTDPQAAERRIDELIDDLIEAARAVEMHDYAPPGRGRALEFPAAQADLQGVRDQLQEAIAEYRTPEREPDGWRPIDTAPKDGTTVLVLWDDGAVGAWWDILNARFSVIRIDRHGCGCCSSDYDKPTHWMPLPAAKAAESEAP